MFLVRLAVALPILVGVYAATGLHGAAVTFAVAFVAFGGAWAVAHAVRDRPRARVAVIAAGFSLTAVAAGLRLAAGPFTGGRAAAAAPVLYVEVDAIAGQPLGRPLRVHGFVKPGTLLRDGAGEVAFTLAGTSRTLTVTYRGPVPDTFRDGIEAVVAGELTAPDRLRARELIVKCPSRYGASAR